MRQKISILLILFFWLALSATAFCQIELKAEVDKTSLAENDLLTYKLTILRYSKKGALVELPQFKDFTVVSQAQSFTTNFLKGKLKVIETFVFILKPKQAGKLKIPASQARWFRRVLRSPEFEINVTPSRARPAPPVEKTIPDDSQLAPEEEAEPESHSPKVSL